jgi:threonine dehydrogenase-like Zn-dependent dehydrogenase
VQFTSQRNARELIALISEKRLKVMPLVTHKMSVSEVSQAAELLIGHPDKAMGIILTY